MNLEFEWTDERNEDESLDRVFDVRFYCTDKGYGGGLDEPARGPEFQIQNIREWNGTGWNEADGATWDLIAAMPRLQEEMATAYSEPYRPY